MPQPAEPVDGVIDSIRDGVALILLGDEEREITVPADQLPPEAKEGSRVEAVAETTWRVTVVDAEPPTGGLTERLDSLRSTRPSRLLRRPDEPQG